MDRPVVLIANPCDAERRLLAHALRGCDFQVREASCAKEAVVEATRGEIQLVLLDALGWFTPAMNALSVLKHNPQTRRIPVVIFGQPKNKEDVVDAMQKGAATWIGRQGFELDSFVSKLRKTLEKAAKTPVNQDGSGRTSFSVAAFEKITPEEVSSALEPLEHLPAFEFNIMEAVTTTCSKDQAFEHIVGIALRDPMMTTAVLSEAAKVEGADSNATIVEVAEAVAILNTKGFYHLAEAIPPLSLNLSSLWDPGHFWLHSVATSRIAGMLSTRLGLCSPDEAATAGLLHDLGYYILANHFPRQYGALYSAAQDTGSINPIWEKNLLGVHHGELAAMAMKHFQLPPALQEVARLHHVPATLAQNLTGSTRIVAMIVQAADRIASALFPGDPVLSSLANPEADILSTLERTRVRPSDLIDDGRKIMAELVTEMSYLFPQSAAKQSFYHTEPLSAVCYLAPGKRVFDVIQTYFEVRSAELVDLSAVRTQGLPADVPVVVNLAYMPDPAAQIEMMTTMVASRMTENRQGVVLVPGAANKALNALVPANWTVAELPTHPANWIGSIKSDSDEVAAGGLCVA